jgi:hypothetical protein
MIITLLMADERHCFRAFTLLIIELLKITPLIRHYFRQPPLRLDIDDTGY